MFTSWSLVDTPAELSRASVFRRPPAPPAPTRAYSMRPAWVMARFAPSARTRARRSAPLTRRASLARSPASAWDSPDAFT